MIIRFPANKVRGLVAHAEKAKKTIKEAHGNKSILLVGDVGIYLLSSGDPQPDDDMAVYADGVNPDVDKDWEKHKLAIFGHRDGVDILPLADIKKAVGGTEKYLRLDVTPEAISVVTGVKKNTKRKPIKLLGSTRNDKDVGKEPGEKKAGKKKAGAKKPAVKRDLPAHRVRAEPLGKKKLDFLGGRSVRLHKVIPL